MIPYAKRMEHMAFTANVVKGLFGSMTNPDIISFGGGSPAKEALPVDIVRQLADEVLRTDGRGVEALQYGPLIGVTDLREVVVRELLRPKGIDCGVDNVIIITGGLEGLMEILFDRSFWCISNAFHFGRFGCLYSCFGIFDHDTVCRLLSNCLSRLLKDFWIRLSVFTFGTAYKCFKAVCNSKRIHICHDIFFQ